MQPLRRSCATKCRCFVRGQVSDIVRQESADQFLSRFPQVEFTDVRGAGHMVAGDRNDAFAGAVLDFLARHVGVR